MIKCSKLICLPFLLFLKTAFASDLKDINDVYDFADKAGRRMCSEIFEFGYQLKYASGSYVLDADGYGINETILAKCDAVTGMTQLLSMVKGENMPDILMRGYDTEQQRFLAKVFVENGKWNVELKDDYKYTFTSLMKSETDELKLFIPIKTRLILIKDVQLGKVKVFKKVDDQYIEKPYPPARIGKNVYFTDLSLNEDYYLQIKPENGRIELDSIWIK